jgi:hypothetical protein
MNIEVHDCGSLTWLVLPAARLCSGPEPQHPQYESAHNCTHTSHHPHCCSLQCLLVIIIILGPCLDAHEKLKIFHSLSITSIFGPMHEVVNVGKNNN